jgi:ABC-type Na+ efflux pump permease subunit
LRREKTIVLALLVQLFIAGFSSFLVVGLTSPYDPSSAEGNVVNIGSTGATQEELVEISRQNDDMVVERYENRDQAIRDFATGDLDAVVTGRPAPTENGTRFVVTVVLPTEDIQSTLVVVTIRELLANLEEAERIARVDQLEFRPVQAPTGAEAQEGDTTQFFGFTYTILIPLLLFLPPFISGSVVIDLVTEEFERGTIELLRVSPVSLVDIVDGKAVGMIALAPIQAALWILLLQLNGIAIGHIPSLLVVVTATATVTVAIGMVLGLETGRRRRAQFLYSMLMILLFASAVVLPEHPASTVVKLAIDSPTLVSFGQVAGLAVVSVAAFLLARWHVTGVDPESL